MLDDALSVAFRLKSIYMIDLLIEYGASIESLRRSIEIDELYKNMVTFGFFSVESISVFDRQFSMKIIANLVFRLRAHKSKAIR